MFVAPLYPYPPSIPRYPDIDWKGWPPAPANGGPTLLQINVHVICDDAKQDAVHLQSALEVEYSQLAKMMPWLTEAFVQSDQAVNFHGVEAAVVSRDIGKLTGIFVKEIVFTEAGEGKGEVDGDNGLSKLGLKRYRDRGNDYEDAEELFKALEEERLPGQWNGVMEMDRSQSGAIHTSETSVRNQSAMMVFGFPGNGTIVWHESRGMGPGLIRCVRGGRGGILCINLPQ